jgi:MFS family permease
MSNAIISPKANRLAVAGFFFIAGLSFASWASRIPDIKLILHLSDAALGGVLFALPAGSMVSLPLAGWLVSKYGSKRIVTIAMIGYPTVLLTIGLVTTIWQLIGVLFVFGLFGKQSV